MNEQVRTIFEAFLMITGFSRCELCEDYSEEIRKKTVQNVMIKMLSKIVSIPEIREITSFNTKVIN